MEISYVSSIVFSTNKKNTQTHTSFWLYMTYWIFGNVHSSWRVKNWGALLLIWFTKCHSWYTMSPWGCFYLIHLLWLWWVMIHISPPVFLFTIPLPAEMKVHNTNRVVWKDTITMVNRWLTTAPWKKWWLVSTIFPIESRYLFRGQLAVKHQEGHSFHGVVLGVHGEKKKKQHQ